MRVQGANTSVAAGALQSAKSPSRSDLNLCLVKAPDDSLSRLVHRTAPKLKRFQDNEGKDEA